MYQTALSEPRAGVNRRRFLRDAGLSGGAAFAAACAPGVTEPGSGGFSGGAGDGWEAEWDQLLAAAKREGQVAVNTQVGATFAQAVEGFRRAFPSLTVEHHTYTSLGVFAPKAIQEREAGIHTYDVSVVPPNTAMVVLKPAGAWDPIVPALSRPDVLDDKSWRGGFNAGFIDSEKMPYVFAQTKNSSLWMNTDLVKPDELKGVRDLLNPKWKGRMIFADVRSGHTFLAAAVMRRHFGDDFLKQLFVDQQPAYRQDLRAIAEGMVRGQYAIGLGARVFIKGEFWPQGLGKNLKEVHFLESDWIQEACVFLHNRAPHPNGASLFLNWLLSKAGQEAWCGPLEITSRRTDVDPPTPELALYEGDEKKYLRDGLPEEQAWLEETRKLLERLVV